MKKQRLIGILAAAITVIALWFVPNILNNDYYQQVANTALIYTCVVLGLNFITGLTGQMVLGMSGVFAVGAYTASILYVKLGWNFFPCLLACVFAGVLVGLIIGFPCLRLKGIYLAICTIGFGEVVRLCATNLDGLTGGSIGMRQIGGIRFGPGLELVGSSQVYYVVLIVFVIFVWAAQRICKSQMGMAFKSVRDNEVAASTLGINIMAQKLKAFMLCCVYASVAGMLYAASTGYIAPTDFSYDMSVRYVMMLIIGGIGTVPGSIIGGIAVTVIPELLRFAQDYYWCCFGIVTVLMVVLRPYGLYSILADGWRKVKRKRDAKAIAAK